MEVECPRCEEIWQVNPRKWRNFNSILKDGRKKIHCPFCNKLIILNQKMTKELLKEVEALAKNRPVRKK